MPTFVVEDSSLFHVQVSPIDRPDDTVHHRVEGLVVEALGSDCVEQIPANRSEAIRRDVRRGSPIESRSTEQCPEI